MSGFRKPPPKGRSPFTRSPLAEGAAVTAIGAAGTAFGGQPASAPVSGLGARQDFRELVGFVADVPLSLIQSNPVNPRAHYPATSIDEMATSLASKGQQVAAQAFPSDDGQRVVLMDGERRFRGARALGLEALRIEICAKPKDDRSLYEAARAANVERANQTALDDAIRWRQLIEQGVYKSQTEIASGLAIDEGTVSRTLALADIPEPIVLILIADHPDMLSLRMLTALREFFRVTDLETTIELIHEAAKEGFGYREVNIRRARVQAGPQQRTRAEQTAVRAGDNKGVVKVNRDRGDFSLAFKGMSPATLIRLEATIQAFLDGIANKDTP